MNLELTIVDLVGFGFSEDYILNMDVESFDVLVQRVLEVQVCHKVETLWSRFLAAQGTKKGVQSMAEALDPRKLSRRKDPKDGSRSRRT